CYGGKSKLCCKQPLIGILEIGSYTFAIRTPVYGINLLIRCAINKRKNTLLVCKSIICTDFDSLVNQLRGKYSESLKPPLPKHVLRILIQIQTQRQVIFHIQLR